MQRIVEAMVPKIHFVGAETAGTQEDIHVGPRRIKVRYMFQDGARNDEIEGRMGQHNGRVFHRQLRMDSYGVCPRFPRRREQKVQRWSRRG